MKWKIIAEDRFESNGRGPSRLVQYVCDLMRMVERLPDGEKLNATLVLEKETLVDLEDDV